MKPLRSTKTKTPVINPYRKLAELMEYMGPEGTLFEAARIIQRMSLIMREKDPKLAGHYLMFSKEIKQLATNYIKKDA